ncbi:CpsD/CapB family tyrosine-protein kinase [Jannaschia sp. W003]|uniref:CpsD/CapB family tyrosine-protein kinase n=1 Tax=Jannaschia sp. W003 TaxID=2867012 RepID=UPI0021A83D40|nr:CpsD/CapB family tyrosine-protein kinase [Jannaschia sp. W003]UWQ23214.1 CpsD/CapB family tyrosine-protein kinase [Jannaschia sp. W003]
MERLRVAIDRARAARDGTQDPHAAKGGAASVKRTATAAKAEPADAQRWRESWDAVEGFDIPPRQLERQRIVAAKGPGKGMPEAIAFDKLRTRVTQEMRAKGWKRLAITSPGPNCGKSTIALNLGFTFARRDDERVVLLEMDLRRPSLARIAGLSTRKDFAEVLRGEGAFTDHAVRLDEKLAMGAVRSPRPRSAELLQSRSAAVALDAIEEAFDPTIMIFDTAPVLSSDDTLGFLDRIDCVLIVAAAGTTSIAEIDNAEREVAAHSKVLGVVLNKCEYADETGKYDYYS